MRAPGALDRVRNLGNTKKANDSNVVQLFKQSQWSAAPVRAAA